MSLGAVDLFNQLAQNDFGFFQKIQSVSSIMSGEVKTLTLDHTYQEAVALFRRAGIRHAPVVEEGDIVGIVSDRDLLRHHPPLLGTAAEGNSDRDYLRTPVSKLMTRGPLSVHETGSPESALTLMLDRHVDSVLVRDSKRKLVGIVTATDFMKTVLLFHRVCTGSADLVRFRLVDLDMSRGLPLDLIFSRGARSVRDVMTKDVVPVDKGHDLGTAIEMMQTLEVRHLPVQSDKGDVLGFLSDRDVLSALPSPIPIQKPKGDEACFRERLFSTKNTELSDTKVGSLVLTQKPAVVQPGALLTDAISLMMKNGISGLPVIEDERLCGIITTTDVLRVFRVIMQIGSIVAPEVASRTHHEPSRS